MRFGHGSIEKELYDYIITNFKGTILELGSGWGTSQLANYFEMISIEHDEGWIDCYESSYIYAPLMDDGIDYWYDINQIKKGLQGKKYDLILVDGPTAYKKGTKKRRQGFYRHLKLFDMDRPIIFDDVDRKWDKKNFIMTAQWLKRNTRIIKGSKKQFGVIL